MAIRFLFTDLSNLYRKLQFALTSGIGYIYIHADSLRCPEAMSSREGCSKECSFSAV